MPSHFDSGRVTDKADSQQNQPEPVLRAAGKKHTSKSQFNIHRLQQGIYKPSGTIHA